MSVAFRDAFDRRIQRHAEKASGQLAEAQRQVMAESSARGLLKSGPRLEQRAQVRNEHLADLADCCPSEVMGLPGDVTSSWNEHGHVIRGSLADFMKESRAPVLSGGAQNGAAAEDALAEILDRGDAYPLAELYEFGSGVWRPRLPREEVSVTSNTVNVGDGATVGNIQQAGNHAHQQSANILDIGSMQQALDAFDRAAAEVDLSEQARAAIRAEIETIRPQLSKPAPSAVIVRESLKSLRNIVEEVAAGALLTPQFGELMAAALPLIGAA